MAISNLELGLDEPLSEAGLAQRFGFGRTPVREAVHRLRQDGLVVSVPRRGLFVSSFSSRDVREIYDLLEALDGMAALLATAAADAEALRRLRELNSEAAAALARNDRSLWQERNFAFHRLLIQVSGNQRLRQSFELLHDQLKRALLLTVPLRDNQAQAMDEHRAMLAAMERGDAEAARQLAQRHRRRVREEVVAALESFPLPGLRY